jgi:adenylate kinase family enzyme
MARVLVTGLSGAGKSTLLAGLARRGHSVLDTDYDGWVLADGGWDEARMSDLLARETSIVISGTVENRASSTIASTTSCCCQLPSTRSSSA